MKNKNGTSSLSLFNLIRYIETKKGYQLILFLILLILLTFIVYSYLPVHENSNPPKTWGFGVDWKDNIREASLRLLSGKTPYQRVTNSFPPWTYLLLMPVAVLPPDLGAAVMFVLSYLLYIFILTRMNAKPLAVIAFLINGFAYTNALNGNLDSLAAIGFILPPQIGLFFVVIKPQIGTGIAFYWLIESYRKGKLREIIRVFGPVIVAYLISFVIFGFWPLRLLNMPNDPYNASLWPFGIIVGIFLLYKSISDKNKLFAIGAAPFLAPYVNITSYAVTLLPFVPYDYLMLITVILSRFL